MQHTGDELQVNKGKLHLILYMRRSQAGSILESRLQALELNDVERLGLAADRMTETMQERYEQIRKQIAREKERKATH